MTREEAISVLEMFEFKQCDLGRMEHTKYTENDVWEAMLMAIEALSKPNYESDNEVRLAVTNRNKDKVVLWDAFGEVEYYPNGEINCVHCPHYHETEDDTGVHSHCGSHGRLIDADAMVADLLTVDPQFESMIQWCITIVEAQPTVQADKHGEWIYCEDTVALCVDGYKCSECGFFVPWDYEHKSPHFIEDYHFCPKCRTRMTYKGGEE